MLKVLDTKIEPNKIVNTIHIVNDDIDEVISLVLVLRFGQIYFGSTIQEPEKLTKDEAEEIEYIVAKDTHRLLGKKFIVH